MLQTLNLTDYEYRTGNESYRFESQPFTKFEFVAYTDRTSTLYLITLGGEVFPWSVGTRHEFKQEVQEMAGLLLQTDKRAQVALRCLRHSTVDHIDPTPLVVHSDPTDGQVLRTMDPLVLAVALRGMGLDPSAVDEIAEEMTFDDLLDDEDFGDGFHEGDDLTPGSADAGDEPSPAPEPPVPAAPVDNPT